MSLMDRRPKIGLSEFAVQLNSGLVVSKGGFYCSIEHAEKVFAAFEEDPAPKLSTPDLNALEYTFGTWLRAVTHVFRLGAESEILFSVVEAIPVYVIDYLP